MNAPNIHAIEVALGQAGIIRYGQPDQGTLTVITEISRDAVERAIVLRRLARAAEQTGFLALPLDQYLSRLARSAEVEIAGVLSPVRGSHTAARVMPWVVLAGQLQLAVEHVRLWVRVWFATEFQASPQVVMARGATQVASGGHSRKTLGVDETASPEGIEDELQRLEGRYTPAHRAELETALRTFV